MPRVALCLEYDGRPFAGWQSQADRTAIQDTVERAIASFVGSTDRVPIVAAGRTDAGVHALGQVVHCDVQADREPFAWVRGLNALLPASIAVRSAQIVIDDFHARFSAYRRDYLYRIHVAPARSPLLDGRVAWIFRPLDVDHMREAGQILVGERDFSSFRSSECQAKSPRKTIYRLELRQAGDIIEIAISANAFLHHMVRNIVGSLVYVGLGRRPIEWMSELLAARDRKLAAPTLSAAGLYFAAAHYPESFQFPATLPAWWSGLTA